MRSPFRVLTWALTIVLSGACAMGLRHSATIDGKPLSYVSAGRGPTTVILEAGIGSDLSTWSPIFEDLTQIAPVFAYSRAGYSGAGFGSQDSFVDADRIAQHLRRFVELQEIPTPFVLVGHSAGGNYVLRYASLYPDDVAGVVLLDARPRTFQDACRRAGVGPCAPPKGIELLSPPHVAAELRGLRSTELLTPNAEQLGPIPVTVLVATQPPVGVGEDVHKIWLREQRAFADGLKNGRYLEVDEAGHFIHKDAPGVVIDEIRGVLDQLKQRF